jgi:deoxyribodipyrimidine photo-lyase
MKPVVDVVWFKRDLRVQDHAALYHACNGGHWVLPLYVEEPLVVYSPTFAEQHAGFLRESLEALNQALQERRAMLFTARGHLLHVLEQLREHVTIHAIHSHEETGEWATYERDVHLSHWCKREGIPWYQYRQFGVLRAVKDLSQWAEGWKTMMEAPIAPTPSHIPGLAVECLPAAFHSPLLNTPFPYAQYHAERQKGGATLAQETLHSFLEERGKEYSRHLSSPATAECGCTRLSPYITFGCISIRQVYQAIRLAQHTAWERYPKADARRWVRSMKNAESRLYWHCHFVQKLETRPRIEYQSLHRAYDALRPATAEAEARFRAFQNAETGVPMIDACLRYLFTTGWINFRMRALLVSFACYQLWIPWQWVAAFLASHFIDYEPGIHVYQAQMQSAATGFNTVRIYCPIKQAKDQDPTGAFIARWLPELAELPLPYRYAPWELPPLLAQSMGFHLGVHYPAPLVDLKTAYDEAKAKVFALRDTYPIPPFKPRIRRF